MLEEETPGIESKIGAPDLSCPKCDQLLPNGLGIIHCVMCKSDVKVEHEGTRKKWRQEKVSCPDCSKILVVGVDSSFKFGGGSGIFLFREGYPQFLFFLSEFYSLTLCIPHNF